MAVRRMSAQEARARFSELLGVVYYTKEPVMVERKGKPFAVVISPDQYALVEKELERAWQTVDRVRERNVEKDPDEVFQDVTATVEAVRQELYEEARQSRPRRR